MLTVATLAAVAFVTWAIAGGGQGGGATPVAQVEAWAGALTHTAPEPEPEPEPEADPTTAEAGLDLTANSTTDPASPWVIVNKQHPLTPSDWAPDDLVAVDGVQVRAAVATDLEAMLAAAAADGVEILPRDGYRSFAGQAAARAAVEQRRGFEHAERYSARPGFSEHQTGLALDVDSGSTPSCDLQTCFAQTPEGRWVAERGHEFGFLVRYTPENTETTGYAPEGWHLRWVGRDLAGWMHAEGRTSLEDVFGVAGGATYLEQ